MPTTEVLRARLHPGNEPEKVLQMPNTFTTAKRVLRLRQWGVAHRQGFCRSVSRSASCIIDCGSADFVLDWDSIEAHQEVELTEEFPQMVQQFLKLVVGEVSHAGSETSGLAPCFGTGSAPDRSLCSETTVD